MGSTRKHLINHFHNDVIFEAEYPEAKGETFTSAPNGDQKNLIYELKTHKRYVFRNNFGNNPKTGQDWTSQDVIIDLLLKEDLLWLQQDSLLHYIMSPS